MKHMPTVPTVPTCSYWVHLGASHESQRQVKPLEKCEDLVSLGFLHVKCVGMREWMQIYMLL